MNKQDEVYKQIIALPSPPLSSLTPCKVSQTAGDNPLPIAAYLHIPFCRTRCRYCDFAVNLGTEELIEKYVQYLVREVYLTPSTYQGLRTVYFGGGTPSLLNGQQLEQIIKALQEHFRFAENIEITLEANPGTFSFQQVRTWQSLGINRISLGVQAFQDRLLALCGRSHGLRAVYESIDNLGRAGVTNWNLDLIFGLPEQSLKDWEFSLAELIRLSPTHVSAYDLILEDETPFHKQYRNGRHPLPDDDETVQMYLQLIETLTTHGYDHYEIANFARPGRQSAHNRVYWHNQPYYGLGLGATGYVHKQRIARPKRLFDYFQLVGKGDFPTSEPVSTEEELTDTLILGLRLLEGVSLAQIADRFGVQAADSVLAKLQPSIERGWVSYQSQTIALTTPQGLLFSNEVFSLFV